MAAVIKVLPQLRASVNEWRTLRSAIALSTSMSTYKERKWKQTNKKWPIDRSTASTCCPPPPSSPSPTFSTDWCRSETSYDVTVGSVLPDNTPTPPGLPLPRQQGELLCPGGMCAMTHRLLSPTQDTHAVVHTHRHTHTLKDIHSCCLPELHSDTVHHWVYSAVPEQKGQGLHVGCGGGPMEMLPGATDIPTQLWPR